jgi:hypothetical protein
MTDGAIEADELEGAAGRARAIGDSENSAQLTSRLLPRRYRSWASG